VVDTKQYIPKSYKIAIYPFNLNWSIENKNFWKYWHRVHSYLQNIDNQAEMNTQTYVVNAAKIDSSLFDLICFYLASKKASFLQARNQGTNGFKFLPSDYAMRIKSLA